jgi:gluconate 2-dehydrogenase gamma chain
MTEQSLTRRGFVGAMAGAAAATWLSASWSDLNAAAAHAAEAAPDAPYQVLTRLEVKELDAITAQLVPTDDTPGAREAHVVRFIDRSLATWAKDEHAGMQRALGKVSAAVSARVPGSTSFASLGDADQKAVLTELHEKDPETFFAIHGPTVVGMFSLPKHGGNFGKVGWKLLGFKDQFSWVPPYGYYDRG